MMYRRIGLLTILGFLLIAVVMAGRYFLKTSRDRARSKSCFNSINQFVYHGRQWAALNGGRFPEDFLYITDEQGYGEMVLVCPSDGRQGSKHLRDSAAEMSSYEMVSPGISSSNTDSVYVRCRIHGYLGYTDRCSQQDVIDQRGGDGR